MSNNLFTSTNRPNAGSFGLAAHLLQQFAAIEAAFEKLRYHFVTFEFADLNTAATRYQVAQVPGTIVEVRVINDAGNAGADTTITLTNNGSPVTMPALQVDVADAAGTTTRTSTPTANHALTTGSNILAVTTDGGGSSVMPGRVVVKIDRG